MEDNSKNVVSVYILCTMLYNVKISISLFVFFQHSCPKKLAVFLCSLSRKCMALTVRAIKYGER